MGINRLSPIQCVHILRNRINISTIILMKSFHIIVEVSCIQRMMNLLMISMLIGIIIIWNL